MATAMQVQQIAEGLWRWTAPHPEWRPEKDKPGGWGQMVGCVAYQRPGAVAMVLIDPQLPPEGGPDAERFWAALERDLEPEPELPVAILLGNHYHERSAGLLYERYRFGRGASVWISHNAIGRVGAAITGPFRPGDALPAGVQGHGLTGLSDTETAFYLPEVRTLVFSDAVIGAGDGRLRIAPEAWADATPEAVERYRKEYRSSLRRLLDLDIEHVLVSHGDCALGNGRKALAEALEARPWGES